MSASMKLKRLQGGVAFICHLRHGIPKPFDEKTTKRWNSTNASTNEHYCMDVVKKHDYENFLCTLLLPKNARTATFALRAFNVDVATVKDNTSDIKIAQMRMQFWKETINEIYQGSPRQTPIACELHRAVASHKLSKRWFSRIIEERERNLHDKAHASLEDVENSAEKTTSSLLYLILETLGLKDVNADHAASHIGKSHGIVTLLRSTPHHASRRRVYLPMEILIKYGVSQEQILRGKTEQNLKDAVFEIASQANSHLQKAQSMKKEIPKEAYSAFLLTTPIEIYLKKIQQSDFDVFHPTLQQKNTMLPFKLWTKSMRSAY
ncbi:NADH dehydrogenase (ubiquinone) complex I, assembly factor 6-like [Saccoglossus kowalevskii]|uniref:15-cis-phytoene synthase n=1 Tax=Saccoglossus kowalevskii TaxID=10224 RepID=A0ABM0GQV5_SACKO|nr:PREDICTED: NADH dehydrogenase (ubiquinone) complex I, assembly factor 6-like [Saccoglossus kowalevskii]